jgi:hypothetical protein
MGPAQKKEIYGTQHKRKGNSPVLFFLKNNLKVFFFGNQFFYKSEFLKIKLFFMFGIVKKNKLKNTFQYLVIS